MKDFEVHPIGTSIEMQQVRKFANELIKLTENNSRPEEVLNKIQELKAFYEDHNQRFSQRI